MDRTWWSSVCSLKSILDKNHRIHWHCFDGNVHNYHNIKQEFPNTKFGISPFPLMDEQHPDFRTKVCEMDLQDIVMESDSPYIRPEGFQDVSPYLLKDIIWKLTAWVPLNQSTFYIIRGLHLWCPVTSLHSRFSPSCACLDWYGLYFHVVRANRS